MIARGNICLSVVIAVILMLTGCSSRALHEAQEVVAQADSLRAEGVAYTDSVTMAEAYNTLEKWQYLYPTDYARACYYYGRLLRNNDNPVAAMQVFINATHTNTRDYHILARTYSNMGSICHLASEYQLAYDMYSRSADMFLKNEDSLLYYCALNEAAFELAVQGEKEETLSLINSIEYQCANSNLLKDLMRTKAEMYLYASIYDSAIYYSTLFYNNGGQESSALMIKSQAYSYLGEKDSAVYYAKQVIAQSTSIYDLGNAYYMLTNDNTLAEVEDVKEMAATRADILLEVRNRQGKLSQAVQLLEQDLGRRPDMRWLYVVIGIILFIISAVILYYIWRKRKQHHRLVVEVQEKKQEQNILEDSINNLSLLQTEKRKQIIEEVESVCEQFRDTNNIKKDLRWNDYETMCSIVNFRMFGIVDQLRAYSLSEKEIRLCLLVLIQASTKQMVDLLPYAQSGLGKLKYTTARKLGTNTPNLRIFLLDMMK